jgi:NADH dehydrogenase
LAAATGAATDRAGRVIVEPDCTVAGHPEIFVIGDLAHFQHGSERPLPGIAPVAMQQGMHVARTIMLRLQSKKTEHFRYRSLGSMATIGRARAVADFGWLQLSGFLAWLAWLFVHLINLVGFQNRLLVLVQWGINYITRNRAARLITEESADRFSAAAAAKPADEKLSDDREQPTRPT